MRFGDICASEKSAALCPSLLPAANGAPAAVTDASPIDGARHVPLSMPLRWDRSKGATSYKVYFGTSSTPALVATVTDSIYAVALEFGKTYYYQIAALNDTGETRTAVYKFSTLTVADVGGWEVVRGHAAFHVEAPDFYELNTNLKLPPGIDAVSALNGEPGNAAFSYFSGDREATNANYRWRYRQSDGEQTTLVMRVAALPGVSSLTFVEFYGLGWRQKVRINRGSAKFERTDGSNEFDFPEGFWEDSKPRILRFTFAPTPGGNMVTKLYLDEATVAFASGESNEAKTSNYIDIGRNGGDNYGVTFDYVAINPTGAFEPDSTGAPTLPSDLFVGGGGSNGAPLAVTKLLPLDKAVDVPLTMPIAWEGNEASTSYKVYLGTTQTPTAGQDYQRYDLLRLDPQGRHHLLLPRRCRQRQRRDAVRGQVLHDARPGQRRYLARDPRSRRTARRGARGLRARYQPRHPGSTRHRASASGRAGNAAYGYLSAEKEGSAGNYRFRFRQNEPDQLTLLLRVAPLPDNDNLVYIEFYGLGWRQKLRLNQSTAKFEKTPDDPEFTFPDGFWKVDTFRTIRVTFERSGGNVMTKIYLGESTKIFGQGLSDEEKEGSYLDIGRAGGENYGAYFDYLAINPTGAFAPGALAAPAPPADLIVPAVVVGLTSVRDIAPLSVYPNPVTDLLRVDSELGGRPSKYRIFSATGQTVLIGALDSDGVLNVGQLPSGTYMLQVMSENGELAVGRFTKV